MDDRVYTHRPHLCRCSLLTRFQLGFLLMMIGAWVQEVTYSHQRTDMTPAILTVTSKDTVVREQLTPQPYLVNGMSLADTQAAIAVGKSHTPLPITNPILLNSPV